MGLFMGARAQVETARLKWATPQRYSLVQLAGPALVLAKRPRSPL